VVLGPLRSANIKTSDSREAFASAAQYKSVSTAVVTKGEDMARSFRFMAFRCAAALPLCCVACVLSNGMALAQSEKITTFQAGCSQESASCPKGTAFGFQGNFEVVRNQPYKAQANTETRRTLADGSHITQSTTAMIARDSEGRTVDTQKIGDSLTITTIFDAVAKTHIDYTSDGKIAHVLALPAPSASPSQAPVAIGAAFSGFAAGPPSGAVGFFVQGRAASPQLGNQHTTTESLGNKTIEGIQVTGTRTTSTIPAGTIGNEEALTTTREEWYSPELKIVVQSTQNDPRFGQTTYTLNDIQQGPPDETLFQVPADYKIEEIPVPKPAS
jgi:hypothetical protein